MLFLLGVSLADLSTFSIQIPLRRRDVGMHMWDHGSFARGLAEHYAFPLLTL